MRRLFTALVFSLLLGTAGTMILTSGCKTTQQGVAFKTLSGVEISTDGAYKAYLDLAIAGKVQTNSVPAVSADYALFQASMRAAIALAQGNTNAVAPQSVLDASAKLVSEISKAKGTK